VRRFASCGLSGLGSAALGPVRALPCRPLRGGLFDIVKRTFIRLRAGFLPSRRGGRGLGRAAYIAPASDGCEARWSYLSCDRPAALWAAGGEH